ncbi:MAG: hypothetical protein COA47_09935 [Robiginitomaculum sp.]|nr:MAG: hypothetical protein COA47_09935 [Robiginitomaculum sp.]
MQPPIKVHLRHARELQYCSSGIRDFCKMYNLKFMVLVREGLDADDLFATGDTLAINMAQRAVDEWSEENGG